MQAIITDNPVGPRRSILNAWNADVVTSYSVKSSLLILPQLYPQLIIFKNSLQGNWISRIVVVHNKPVNIETLSISPVFGFTLDPSIANQMLNIPKFQVSESRGFLPICLFDDCLDSLIQAKTVDSQIQILENWLRQWNFVVDTEHPKFLACLKVLTSSEFPIVLQEICKDLNITVRSLERWFKLFYNCTPFQFIKLLRLERILKRISDDKSCSLSDLAFDMGFADPSHFSRDFKKLTGYRPSDFKIRIDNKELMATQSVNIWTQICWSHCMVDSHLSSMVNQIHSICGGIDLDKEVI